MSCPTHGDDCTWYRYSADQVGADLGYGSGWATGVRFAAGHPPMATHLLPLSDGRGDYFALGFLDGIVSRWCPRHPWDEMQADERRPFGARNRCLARHVCRTAVAELAQRSTAPTSG